MPFFVANGLNLRYTDSGQRSGLPAVVWIHGIGHSLEYWEAVLPRLEGYRHVCLDVCGHGQSDGRKEALTLRDLSLDVQALLKHLDIDKAVFIGHSMGGVIAQRVALDAPHLALALVLVATSSRVGKAARAAYEQAAALSEQRGSMGTAAVQRAMALLDFDAELRSLRSVPVLILQGGLDTLTPPRAGELLRAVLPVAVLRVFPQAGHDIMREDPEVLESVSQWLAGIVQRTSKL